MAEEEHLLVTKINDNGPEAWNPPHPPLCYELRPAQPVLHESRVLRLQFKNYYVHEISVKAVFEQDDTTHNFLLINGRTLMVNHHTEQASQDRFRLDVELPESSLYLSKLVVFCYQPSQNWSVWRLDDITLSSVIHTVRSADTNTCVQGSTDTLDLIRSLTSILQSNISSSKRNTRRENTSHNLPSAATSPLYHIQLLLYDQT